MLHNVTDMMDISDIRVKILVDWGKSLGKHLNFAISNPFLGRISTLYVREGCKEKKLKVCAIQVPKLSRFTHFSSCKFGLKVLL